MLNFILFIRIILQDDWSYEIALKVHPDSIDKWELGCTTPKDIFVAEDWDDIITDKTIWNLDTLLEGNVLVCEQGYTLIEGRNIILFQLATFPK